MNNRCLLSTRWHVTENVVDEALRWVKRVAEGSLSARGAFHLVLSGGNTPRALYERMSLLQTDWSGWHVWYGDERCLLSTDEARNSHMVYTAWLHDSAIPQDQIHVIRGELGAHAAAVEYAGQLNGVGAFDLVLLGLGEDGHTASLFPGLEGVDADVDVVAVSNAPKPPPDRVSLSARRLSNTHHALFMVTGVGKFDAVAAWRRGAAIPAATICPNEGVDVLIEPVCVGEESKYE